MNSGRPSVEIWPRKPFERSLTMSDPGGDRYIDPEEESSDNEIVECCRQCTNYGPPPPNITSSSIPSNGKRASSNIGYWEESWQMTKILSFLALPLIARQLGILLSKKCNYAFIFIFSPKFPIWQVQQLIEFYA